MKLHREGFSILLISLFISIAIGITNYLLFSSECLWLFISIEALNFVLLLLIVQFFRIPKRYKDYESDQIVCPADGEVVVIGYDVKVVYEV